MTTVISAKIILWNWFLGIEILLFRIKKTHTAVVRNPISVLSSVIRFTRKTLHVSSYAYFVFFCILSQIFRKSQEKYAVNSIIHFSLFIKNPVGWTMNNEWWIMKNTKKKSRRKPTGFFLWWTLTDSNRWPFARQANALPTELNVLLCCCCIIAESA